MRAYHETYGLDTTVTNCSNNYGPYQFPEKLIPLTLINILQGKPLPVYGDGLQVRDWLHVADHCAAIALALTRGRSGEVYNIGGNSETTNIQVVRTLCAIGGRVSRRATRNCARAFPASPPRAGKRRPIDLITHVRDRPGHDRRYAIDYRKAQRELGIRAERAILRQGLRETLEWYLSNRRLVAGAPGARLRGVGREELQALKRESVPLDVIRRRIGSQAVARCRAIYDVVCDSDEVKQRRFNVHFLA